MNIAVCCKFTPDTEDVIVGQDGSPDTSKARWGISDYDLQAIQAAADIGALVDSEAVAISIGGSIINQTKLTKDLMSRGSLSRLIRVADDALIDADPGVTSRVLAALVGKADADVVICGEGSADCYRRVTGSMVAADLGWPCVTCVDKIGFDGDAFICERDLEDGIEVVRVPLPCVIVTTSTINVPPVPNMRSVLAAGKKPVEDVALSDLGVLMDPAIGRVSYELPPRPGRQLMMIEGSPDEAAEKLVSMLVADKVL